MAKYKTENKFQNKKVEILINGKYCNNKIIIFI